MSDQRNSEQLITPTTIQRVFDRRKLEGDQFREFLSSEFELEALVDDRLHYCIAQMVLSNELQISPQVARGLYGSVRELIACSVEVVAESFRDVLAPN